MRIAGSNTRILIESTVVTIVLSTVVVLDFYATNASQLTSATQVVHYAAGTLATVAVCAACLRLLLPGFALWQTILATGLATFTFYSYGRIEGLLKSVALLKSVSPAEVADYTPQAI